MIFFFNLLKIKYFISVKENVTSYIEIDISESAD